MPGSMLQLNFKLNVSANDYDRTVTPLAESFAAVDGLRWKIWLLNAGENEAGGIYLFESEEAREAFLSGPLAAQVASAPFLRELSIKRFDIMPDVTAVTRGPVATRTAETSARAIPVTPDADRAPRPML